MSDTSTKDNQWSVTLTMDTRTGGYVVSGHMPHLGIGVALASLLLQRMQHDFEAALDFDALSKVALSTGGPKGPLRQ